MNILEHVGGTHKLFLHPHYCWGFAPFTHWRHFSQREDLALEEFPVPEANMPTDMVQPFETRQRAPAGRSQMSEQGSSKERMLAFGVEQQSSSVCGWKAKITVVLKLRAWFPLYFSHFLNHLLARMCGAYLTSSATSNSQTRDMNPWYVVRTSDTHLWFGMLEYQYWTNGFIILDSVITVLCGCLRRFLFVPFYCFCAFSAHLNTEPVYFSFQGRRLQHPPSLDWVCGSGYRDGLQLPLPRSDRLHHRHHGADLQGSKRQVRWKIKKRCCRTTNWRWICS